MLTSFSTDRTKRVKDARAEAQKEIEDYRNEKEEEFKKYEKEVSHITPCKVRDRHDALLTHMQQTAGNKDAEEQAEKDTQKQLDDLKQLEKDSGPQVVQDLLNAVVDVRPQAPERVEQPVA